MPRLQPDEIYAAYVNRIPATAGDMLDSWSDKDLLNGDEAAIAKELYNRFAMRLFDLPEPPQFSREALDPNDSTAGVRLFLAFPLANAAGAEEFLHMRPSSWTREPQLEIGEGEISFVVGTAAQVQQAMQAVAENIRQRNRDIRAGEKLLREHMLNITRDRRAKAESRRLAADAELAALDKLGVPERRRVAREPEPPLPPQALEKVPFALFSSAGDHAEALRLVMELDLAVHKALETEVFTGQAAAFADAELVPQLEELRRLLDTRTDSPDASDPVWLVRRVERLFGQVKAGAKALSTLRRSLPAAALAIEVLANIDDAATNTERLVQLIPH
jgi:hypothetical protein